jgi:hypothetical protein
LHRSSNVSSNKANICMTTARLNTFLLLNIVRTAAPAAALASSMR